MDTKGKRPLDLAHKGGHKDIVKILRDAVAKQHLAKQDLDTEDEELRKALAISMEETNSKYEEKEEAADDAQPELLSLHQAVQQREYSLVDTLLTTSPDLAQAINEQDRLGRTPLDLAQEGSRVYELLASKGALKGDTVRK